MALGRQIATCLAVATTALTFTACGEDSSQGPKIPKETADALLEELDELETRINESDCDGGGSAPAALADVQKRVDDAAAAEQIDSELVDDMNELLGNLEDQVNEFCDGADAEEPSSTSSTSTTTETETSSTEDTTSSTTDEEDEPKETTTEPEPAPEPEPEPEPTPPGNGPEGTGPPGQSDGGFESDDGGFAPGRSGSTPNGGQG